MRSFPSTVISGSLTPSTSTRLRTEETTASISGISCVFYSREVPDYSRLFKTEVPFAIPHKEKNQGNLAVWIIDFAVKAPLSHMPVSDEFLW